MDCIDNTDGQRHGLRRDSRKASHICIRSFNLNSNSKLLAVNGIAVRSRRKELGWSQVELGHRSGYSERVIRKAEAGGTLRLQTIKDLAMTLSLGGAVLSLHDLTDLAPDPIPVLESAH